MGTAQPRLKFKQSHVYTWESEPSDERPSEFSNSVFKSGYGQPSEFAGSAFMEPSRSRDSRERKRRSLRIRRLLTLATLGVLLISGAMALLPRLLA